MCRRRCCPRRGRPFHSLLVVNSDLKRRRLPRRFGDIAQRAVAGKDAFEAQAIETARADPVGSRCRFDLQTGRRSISHHECIARRHGCRDR